jgi:hypothetical protein
MAARKISRQSLETKHGGVYHRHPCLDRRRSYIKSLPPFVQVRGLINWGE